MPLIRPPTVTPPSLAASLAAGLLLLAIATSGCGDGSPPHTDDLAGTSDVTSDAAGPVDDTPSATDATDEPECVSDDECAARMAATACLVPRCSTGACELAAVADLTPCDDADACTWATTCVAGQCGQGTPLACNDGNPCTSNSCDAIEGCVFEGRDEGSCDDGDPCSVADACSAGLCKGLPDPACACVTEDDCDIHEDASLCNGVMLCDAGQCKLDQGSVVDCPPAATCRVSTCKPATGSCGVQIAANGTDCDDGNPCTSGDLCSEGTCAGQSGACECAVDSDCAPFQLETFDLCQGPLVCVDGSCEPDAEQAVVCVDDTVESCITTACDPPTGLCVTLAMPEGSSCPATNPCAPAGTCRLGKCKAAPADCDDGDPCTADSCVPGAGCEHTPATGACDDGDACSVGDTCVDGVCTAGVTAVCDDLNPCTADMCIAGPVGCTVQMLDDGAACANSDPCLEPGVCEAGTCVDQQPVTCEDPGPCLSSSCVAFEGCLSKFDPNGSPCDDGNPCTQEGQCSAGECVALPLPCSDGNACTVDGCDEGGCVYELVATGVPCQPGDPCFEGGTCDLGECVGGEPLPCPDGVCDVRECDPTTGTCEIVHLKPDGTECGDANPCTVPGGCDDGACAGQDSVDCDDDDACTVDTCEAEFGNCKHAPKLCAPDAEQPCQAPTCEPATGCQLEADPICESASVVWTSPIACDSSEWTTSTPTGKPGFVIDAFAPAAGLLDDDCHLHIDVTPEAAAVATPWTATTSGSLKSIPATASEVRVRFWSYWQWAQLDAWQDVERRVQLLDAEGIVLGAGALDSDPTTADGWLPLEVVLTLDAPPPVQVRVGFALTSTPSETPGSNAWWIDTVVVFAE